MYDEWYSYTVLASTSTHVVELFSTCIRVHVGIGAYASVTRFLLGAKHMHVLGRRASQFASMLSSRQTLAVPGKLGN